VRGGARIILIGKADVDISRLQSVSNIELLGPIPFAELPAHIARFTVGIIPFVVNDLTRSVNPIKLREMLAAGCPVVSTALPEVERMGRGEFKVESSKLNVECSGFTGVSSIHIAHSHDEFVEMVRQVLANPLLVTARMAVSDSVAGESWAAKVKEILRLVGMVRTDPDSPQKKLHH
jgi:glycosyltransferase involved in cell wall biosynthesis